MKIDITPVKKLTTDLSINVALDVYKTHLYCVEDATGKQVTCTFNPKELDSFLPNRTVSEMMEAWTTEATGKLTFVEYIYNIDLKSDILYGKDIPVIAKKGMFGLYAAGDKLSLRPILYNKDTKLHNGMAMVHKKDGTAFKNGVKHFMVACPEELLDQPLGTTFEHPKDPDVVVTKIYNVIIAPKGSYKSMMVVLPDGGISVDRFGSIPITDLFEKIEA